MAKNKDNQPNTTSNKAKKRKRKLRKATLPLVSLPVSLQRHIECLGIDSTVDYLDWCRQHGFPCGIYKTWEQLEVERRHAARKGAEAKVREARGLRRPDRILRRMVEGRLGSGEDIPDPLVPLQELLCVSRTSAAGRSRARTAQRTLARRLIRHLLDVCPDILLQRVARGGAGEDVFLLAVLRLAEHPEHVFQDPETWRPRSHNPWRRFASLARHLYGRFPVPAFLDAAWFDGEPRGVEHRRWFVLVGAGKNIRTSGKLPFLLTRRMAHYFLKAPEDHTVLEALRFGQVLGLGGDERLAEALRGTRLCTTWGEDNDAGGPDGENEFWVSVLRFFIRYPRLDTAHVAPIVDFLYHQRFEHRDVVGGDGRLQRLGPLQPNLSMRGRNPAALLRQVQNWHHRLGMAGGKGAKVTWPACGIPGFQSVEGDARNDNQRIWTIHELTSGAQLIAEGRKMHHCVATYIHWCRTGRSSIWSLQVEHKTGPIRMLTIEVDLCQRRIVQARGRSNHLPTDLGKKIMGRWAAAAGLTIASWV